MNEYKIHNDRIILNDSVSFPMSEDNRDYIEFKQWLKENKKSIKDIERIEDITVDGLREIKYHQGRKQLVYYNHNLGQWDDIPSSVSLPDVNL